MGTQRIGRSKNNQMLLKSGSDYDITQSGETGHRKMIKTYKQNRRTVSHRGKKIYSTHLGSTKKMQHH